jgi:hypothetical protein
MLSTSFSFLLKEAEQLIIFGKSSSGTLQLYHNNLQIKEDELLNLGLLPGGRVL